MPRSGLPALPAPLYALSVFTLLSMFMLLLPTPAFSYAHWEGYCQQGGQKVITSSVTSSTSVQQSYPQATLSVYSPGTLTLATLFSDNGGTPLSNPLTCSTKGFFSFYAAAGSYDLTFSGTGIAAPFTWGNVQSNEPLAVTTDFKPPLSLQTICTQAAMAGQTLLLTQTWNGLSTQSLNCNIQNLNGLLRPAANQTVTIPRAFTSPALQQVFDTTTNSGAVIAFIYPPPEMSSAWWGGDPTGVLTSGPALQACITAAGVGATCNIPHGAWMTNQNLLMTAARAGLRCADKLTTIAAGTTTIDAVFTMGTGSGFATNSEIIENCLFQGNSHVTTATVRARAASNNIYKSVSVTGGPIAFLIGETTVLSEFHNLFIGANGGSIPSPGIRISSSTQITFINPQVQQGSGVGVDLVGALGTSFFGGTIENLTTGVTIDSTSQNTKFDNVDFEAFSSNNAIVSNGDSVVLDQCYGTGIFRFGASSFLGVIRNAGLITGHVLIDAGALFTTIENSNFDAVLGPAPTNNYVIDNSATNTLTVRNNSLTFTATLLEDYVGGVYNGTIANQKGCVNCIYESGANNAIVGTFGFTHAQITPYLAEGMVVSVVLAHSLATGAGNTFAAFGGSAITIRSGRNPAGGLTTGYAAGGTIQLKYLGSCGCWLDMSQ